MIPEVAHFALILAFCVALSQAVLPLVGVARGNGAMMNYARLAASGQAALVAISFFGLMWSFFANDFSVLYVASHSNSAFASWGLGAAVTMIVAACLLAARTSYRRRAFRGLQR